MMRSISAVSLASAATIATIATSNGQSPNPAVLPTAPPSLSKQMKQFYRENPTQWQEFLSGLAQQQLQPPVGAPVTVPAGGAWITVNNVPAGVSLVQPQLLTDGTVMFNSFCNNTGGIWYKLTPDITGSYSNGTWSQIGTLPVINGTQYSPLWYGSETLPSGYVLINGGEYDFDFCSNNNLVDLTTKGAIYNPANNTWTAVSPPSGWGNIGDAQSVLLANGTYMLANSQSSQQALFGLFSWTTTGTGKADGNDEEGWTLLPNGKVLTVDDACGNNSEIYDPATGAWTSAGSTIVQLPDCNGNGSGELGPQVLRPDGTVVAFGGTTTGTTATAIYNSSHGTWTQGPNIPSVCGNSSTTPCTLADAPAALLPNGNILFAASTGNWPAKNSFLSGTHFFEMSYSANLPFQVSDTADSPSNASYKYNFVVLPNGDVLSTNLGPNVRLYQPANQNYQASWQPIDSWAPDCVSPGGTYVTSGFQFNGLSHGAAYGDDYQSNTNFPIVSIVNNSTGHVFYAKTFNHSSRSVAANSMETTSFTVASAAETRLSTLYVVANGIPSAGRTIDVAGICATTSLASTHDFFFNGNSDIVWHNADGTVAMWEMYLGNISQIGVLGTVPNNWFITGQRDFNGDGNADLLWRDGAGDLAMWFMNGFQVSATAYQRMSELLSPLMSWVLAML